MTYITGGVAGLVLCLFAKFQEWRDKPRTEPIEHVGKSEFEDDVCMYVYVYAVRRSTYSSMLPNMDLWAVCYSIDALHIPE